MNRRIDLNADLGEHSGDGYEGDESLLRLVSSASIACGGHAGSVEVIRRTAAFAAKHGVTVGAHPSYPDRDGFGRRDLDMNAQQLAESVAEQLSLFIDACSAEGVAVRYVKPHGALYNRAVADVALAEALADCIRDVDDRLALLTLSISELARASAANGLRFVSEAFIDRASMGDGTLVPRSLPGAVITDAGEAAARAVTMLLHGRITSIDGTELSIRPESLCVHSDSPGALSTLATTRERLEGLGFAIRPFA